VVTADVLDFRNRDLGMRSLAPLGDVALGEQAAQARLVLRRPVEGCHELFPLLLVEYESRLVQPCLFGYLTRAFHDELRYA
jgi:hypothetical protein